MSGGGLVRRRLHPLSPVFGLAGPIRQFAIPAVLVLFFARDSDWAWWMVFPFVAVFVSELGKVLTLTYTFAPDQLVIRHGVLSRTERQIPYERVQNVELVQTALHRLFRVAEVKLQTGGGADVDAHLRVISLRAVDELRRAVLSAKGARAEEAPRPTILLQLPVSEVLLHGLITGRGVVVLAAIIGFFFELDIDPQPYLERVLPGAPEDMRAGVRDAMGAPGLAVLQWSVMFGIALVALRILAALWAVIRLYGFTLERTGDGLQSRYGLLTRVSATIPRARVQVINVIEGVWYRWLKRAAVRVETAGRFVQEQQNQLGSQWVAPIVRREALEALVREVQPDAELDPPGWETVHPRARTRILRRQLVLIAILVLMLVPAFGAYALLVAVPLVPLAVWHARRLTERLALALTPTSIVTRTGAWEHRRSLARFARIQSVSIRRSPFDRRWGMATIAVDTAGSATESRLAVSYLPEDRAQEIYLRLRAEVARALGSSAASL
ncbi:MAG TPA: PH domain-containing protein [Vicinamibacterales bacterium]|nr:PH domain-containing protein [Vicinamibacterales bacterium]